MHRLILEWCLSKVELEWCLSKVCIPNWLVYISIYLNPLKLCSQFCETMYFQPQAIKTSTFIIFLSYAPLKFSFLGQICKYQTSNILTLDFRNTSRSCLHLVGNWAGSETLEIVISTQHTPTLSFNTVQPIKKSFSATTLIL